MLTAHFDGVMLASVKPLMLEKYKKDRKEKGAAPGSINRDIDCIKNMVRKPSNGATCRGIP